MGREDEGSDLWEWETPRGLFLCLKSSVVRNRLRHFPLGDRVGHSLGSVLSCTV